MSLLSAHPFLYTQALLDCQVGRSCAAPEYNFDILGTSWRMQITGVGEKHHRMGRKEMGPWLQELLDLLVCGIDGEASILGTEGGGRI